MDPLLLVFLASFGSVRWFAGAEYFTDQPPDDYFQRKTLSDCPARFYRDSEQFDVHFAYGGERAKIGEFQHMVAIGWTKNGTIQYMCGGTLISPTFVLTAAHCAYDGDGIEPDTVRLGDTDLGSPEDDEFAQQISIRSFKRHPKHRFSRRYYDIALIELESEANFTEGICPACLWMEDESPRETMDAIGFRALGYAERLSPTLQKVQLNEINKTECMEQLLIDGRRLPDGLVKEQFCASSATMDTCEGDSGGPIQVDRVDVTSGLVPLVVGIVSFGTPCVEGSTGVYTRIASYKEWIEEEIQRPVDYTACARTSQCFYRKWKNTTINIPRSDPIHRVGLLWNITEQDQFQCGATMIDYRFALTSAYCADTKQGSPRYIIIKDNLGIVNEIVPIEYVYVHPAYNPKQPENDIALLKLTKYLTLEYANIKPVCLWREQEVRDQFDVMQFSAYSTAFSDLSEYRKHNYKRYIIGSNIIDNGKCVDPEYSNTNLLCGRNQINLIPNVCEMDYGGPVMNESYQHYLPYLYGVVSIHSKGCSEDLVGTRVYPHLSWIESIVLDHLHQYFPNCAPRRTVGGLHTNSGKNL